MSSYLSYFSRDPSSNFAYEIGTEISGLDSSQSIWAIHEGKLKKAPHTKVTVFVYDVKAGSETTTEVAKNSLKRIKTLRHPNIVTFVDSVESDKFIYLATEPVTPLLTYLENITDSEETDMAVAWGLHQVVAGLSFLVNNCNLIHNNVCLSSIFVDRAGEWKLAGLEYMFGEAEDPPVKVSHGLDKYDPPEKSSRKRSCKWSSDMWGLGCLIWEAFNGTMQSSTALKKVGKIPKNLLPHWAELVSANPVKRPNPEQFITNCRERKQFMDNMFVDCNLFLDEITIKDADVRTAFLERLGQNLDHFPKMYARFKILPCLLNAYQFGDAGAATLGPIFKLGQLLDDNEYQEKIVPCLVKMFSSNDRATRIQLLRQIEHIVCHLKKDVINNQIFPSLASGFLDSAPLIREATIKSILHLADKLDEKNLNEKLMTHFARLQARDDQGPIRTNTTVCLGKILTHLNKDTKQKVAISAFSRSMKDPFPPARSAGCRAMMENATAYTPRDIAGRVIPSISILLCDPEKSVRETGFKGLRLFLEKLEEISDNPEKASMYNPAGSKPTVSSDGSTAASSPANGGDAQASGWAGWVASSAVNLTMAAARTSMAAASKMRKSDSATPTGDETIEVVVDKTEKPEETKTETKKPRSGMKLPPAKPKEEPEEINWDEIEAELKPEEEPETGEKGGWGDDDEDADWGDSWNSEPKTPKKPVKKTNPRSPKIEPKSEIIIEDSPVSKSAMGMGSWGGEDDWNTDDWNAKPKTTNTAAQKKAEREAKLKARKAEMEKKRSQKKGPMKLGTRKMD